MQTYVIERVLNNNCYILLRLGQRYEVVLEFYDMPNPYVGSKIMLHKNLLNTNWPMYTQPYAFKVDNSILPQKIKQQNSAEYAVILVNGKIYSLKRIYG